MNETCGELKAAIRLRVRDRLKGLPANTRCAASAQVCSRLQREPIWRDARSVLLYVPLPDELDVGPLLQAALEQGKELALPGFDAGQGDYLARRVLDLRHDLRPGRFGIPEPKEDCRAVPLNQLDFIAAPGVAFTLDGRRVGRGRGFYDRLLSFVRGVKCGIAFDEQIVDEIPAESHDIRLDCVLTPSRWIQAVRGAAIE